MNPVDRGFPNRKTSISLLADKFPAVEDKLCSIRPVSYSVGGSHFLHYRKPEWTPGNISLCIWSTPHHSHRHPLHHRPDTISPQGPRLHKESPRTHHGILLRTKYCLGHTGRAENPQIHCWGGGWGTTSGTTRTTSSTLPIDWLDLVQICDVTEICLFILALILI